jgi:hypothetical protein
MLRQLKKPISGLIKSTSISLLEEKKQVDGFYLSSHYYGLIAFAFVISTCLLIPIIRIQILNNSLADSSLNSFLSFRRMATKSNLAKNASRLDIDMIP